MDCFSHMNNGTFSNSIAKETSLTLDDIRDAMNKIPKLSPEENLLSIVITKHAPETGLGKCQLEKGFHLIVRKRIWKTQILPQIESNQYKEESLGLVPSFTSFMGVPVYDDDEIGLSVIIEATEHKRKSEGRGKLFTLFPVLLNGENPYFNNDLS
jgi:hypothetical protein